MTALLIMAGGYCGGCKWALDIIGTLTIRPGSPLYKASEGYEYNRLERGRTKNSCGWPWDGYRDRIKKVVIKKGVRAGADMGYIFAFMNKCVSFDVGSLDIVSAESLRYAFRGCHMLKDLVPLSKWRPYNVVTTEGMFMDCRSIVSLHGLEGWFLPRLLDAKSMFSGGRSLTDADAVKNWNGNAERLEHLSGIFYDTKVSEERDPFADFKKGPSANRAVTGWTVCTGIRYRIPFLANIVIPKWAEKQFRNNWNEFSDNFAESARVTAFYDMNGNKFGDIKKARVVYGIDLFDLGYVLETGDYVTVPWSPKKDRFSKPGICGAGIPFYLSEEEAREIAMTAWRSTLHEKQEEYPDWKEKAVKTGGKI